MIAVAVILGVAVAAGRWLEPPPGAAAGTDWVVLNLAFPALVLATIPGLELDRTALVPVAVAWSIVVVSALVVWVVATRAGWSRQVTGALLLVVPLGNTSFLGFPAVEALLGPEGLPTAVLYDQLGTFLALSTYGAVIAARYGGSEAASPGGAAMLRRTVSFPPFVALVVAFALRGVALPGSLTSAFDVLAASLTPLAMVGIGLRLSQRRLSVPDGPVVLGLGLRLFVLPAAVLAVAVVVGGRSSIEWDVSVLESATPPMITAGILATAAGLDEDTVTSLVGLGVVIALFTLPVWAVLIG